MKTSSFFIINPTNKYQGGHSQSQRSFTFGPIGLEMLNADASSTGVPAQAQNEAGRASNSAGNSVSKCFIKSQDILTFNSKLSISGTIPPVHPQAPTSFLPISFHPGGSYIPPESFPAGPLPVNSYLSPDVPPLSRPPPIGAFFAGLPPTDLQADLPILGMPAGPSLASSLAVPPILGPPAGPPVVPSPYTFDTPDFGGPRGPNTPSFSPTPVQPSDNANIRRSISPIPSSPISWSPSPPPPPRIFSTPTETEPTLSALRERNMRGERVGRAGRAGRGGRRGSQGRGNTWGGTGQSRESRQNSPREADQE